MLMKFKPQKRRKHEKDIHEIRYRNIQHLQKKPSN